MYIKWRVIIVLLVLFSGTLRAEEVSQNRSFLKVALLQMHPDKNNQESNLDKAEAYCRRAAAEGADVALTAEMWSIGYTRFDAKKVGEDEKFWAQAVPTAHPSIQRFATLAKELDMAIAIAYEQAWDPRPRNAVTLFDRHGKEVYTYAKVHTSDFKPLETSMTPGEDFYVGVLDTKSGSVHVGSMICYDREHPESARILMLKGAELILTPNACGLDDLRLQQFRIRAVENLVCVAMTNYPKPYMNGCSVAYNARGETVVMAGEEEGVFIATFDLDDLRERRARSIWGNAYRRPHKYKALTEIEHAPIWDRNDGYGKPWKREER